MTNIDLDGSKQSLSSRKHISGSIQSIRDAVGRLSRPHLSKSRTSLASEKKTKHSEERRTSRASTSPIENPPNKSSKSSKKHCIRRGLVVRISAFHAGGPGSIPGVGIVFFSFLLASLESRGVDLILA